jgi:hypothetical protein
LPARFGGVAHLVADPAHRTTSRDMRRAVANVRDYRADAWMSKVIR